MDQLLDGAWLLRPPLARAAQTGRWRLTFVRWSAETQGRRQQGTKPLLVINLVELSLPFPCCRIVSHSEGVHCCPYSPSLAGCCR